MSRGMMGGMSGGPGDQSRTGDRFGQALGQMGILALGLSCVFDGGESDDDCRVSLRYTHTP
jgi:hypothetical protein